MTHFVVFYIYSSSLISLSSLLSIYQKEYSHKINYINILSNPQKIKHMLRPRLGGENEMEMNKKNNFRTFFIFLVWEF